MKESATNPEEILKKEFLSNSDMMKITGLSMTSVISLMKKIRFVSDTLGIRGYIHRQDYFAYLEFKRNESERKLAARMQ